MRSLFRINIITYIFVIVSIMSGFIKDIILISIILLFHELGHIIIMKYYNIIIYSVDLYPYGGIIKTNMLINTNSFKVLFISLGGIINQLFLLLIFYILFRVNIVSINIFNMFNRYNSFILLFNLLPIIPLDGYKIFNSLLEVFFCYKVSIYISFILNIIILLIFFIYLYLYNINNYFIVLFLLFSLIKFISEYKYLINKFYLERILYHLDLKGFVSVNNINYLYKNKFNYINGIDEISVINNKYYSKL